MNIGGPAIQITGLMKNISNSEFEQLLVTGVCGEEEIDYLIEKEIKLTNLVILHGFGRRVNFLADIKTLFEIRNVIKEFKPDIIHSHTAKAGFLGRLASISSFEKHKLVHTFHGHLLHGYFGKFKTHLVVLVERILAFKTDALIAVGEQVKSELLAARIGNSAKFRVIGPGLEIDELPEKEISLKEFGLPVETFIISWIGRVVPIKAPDRILEIALECRARGLDFHFVVVGDGPLLSDLKKKSNSLDLPVTFLGWQGDIEKVLSFSDLVMLTSENEGTPVALIQAQLAGLPVITTDVGSSSEVIVDEKSGFCMEYSASEFADRIEVLAKNPEIRTSFSVIAKRNAKEKFSISRLVRDHEELYRNLVSQSKSSPKSPA
jgi:glycosyltransferase involved in cell wall biosynthesis